MEIKELVGQAVHGSKSGGSMKAAGCELQLQARKKQDKKLRIEMGLIKQPHWNRMER
jgi:hypothetical protein